MTRATFRSTLLALLVLLSTNRVASAANLPSLSPSVRRAFPPDVRANWKLVFATKEGLCPESVEHRGWTRRKHVIRIYHNFIAHDGVQCRDPDRLRYPRRLRFYRGADVNARMDYNADIKIPARMRQLLKQTGPNISARYAANALGEEYFIGYEDRDRLCNNTVLFNAGTMAFLIRPFLRDVNIKNIDVPLTVGKKWLVMVPKYKAGSCLYESKIIPAGPLEETPSPSPNEANADDDGDLPPTGQGIANNGANSNELEKEDTNNGECFPADALVTLKDGSVVTMRELQVGDKVQVGQGQFSEVFMFTHASPTVEARFVRVETESKHVVTLTPGHYIYSEGELVKASSIRVGQLLSLANGQWSRVNRVMNVSGLGLYNPQTLTGDIVVNGVLTSTYTEAVQPVVAHSLLSPLRLAYRASMSDPSRGVLEMDSRFVPRIVRRLLSSP